MADQLDVLVQLEVAGEAAANRAADALRNIGTAASGSTARFGGLQTAFERMEQHEPSRFLRQGTFALESLALSAVGAEGPAGRLAAALGLFAAGTGTGLAIVGGVAAIGKAYDLITEGARKAEEQVKKLREEIEKRAAAGPEAALFARGQQTAEAPRLLTEETAKLAPLHQAYNDAVRRSQGPLVALAGTQKEHADEVERARKAYADQLEKVRELKGALDDLRRPGELAPIVVTPDYEAMRARHEGQLPTRPQDRLGADLYRRAALGEGGNLALPSTLRGVTSYSDIGPPQGIIQGGPTRWDPGSHDEAARDRLNVLALASASFAGVAGVARGGGLASVLSGAGDIAAAVPGGQVPGALLQGFGSLVRLFSGGSAKVTITKLEQEAMAQLRDVLQIPKASSVVVAPGGGDPRATRFEHDRLASKQGVVTLPYG